MSAFTLKKKKERKKENNDNNINDKKYKWKSDIDKLINTQSSKNSSTIPNSVNHFVVLH